MEQLEELSETDFQNRLFTLRKDNIEEIERVIKKKGHCVITPEDSWHTIHVIIQYEKL